MQLVETVPGWRVGDEVVFASTDYDLEQTEKRRITGISGTTLTLDACVFVRIETSSF